METSDSFLTIMSPSQGIYKEKGSSFIGYLFHVEDEETVKEHLKEIKKEHHDARHHCYAYVLGKDGDIWRANDDGEPSGTGGKPILGQIRSKNLSNVLIIVVRYFGGILLGTSGLINAYRTAAENAISNGVIETQTICEKYRLFFPYELMNNIMKVLKEENLKPFNQQYEMTCSVDISVRESASQRILNKFALIEGFRYELISQE